jgi:hypothetical protein
MAKILLKKKKRRSLLSWTLAYDQPMVQTHQVILVSQRERGKKRSK